MQYTYDIEGEYYYTKEAMLHFVRSRQFCIVACLKYI